MGISSRVQGEKVDRKREICWLSVVGCGCRLCVGCVDWPIVVVVLLFLPACRKKSIDLNLGLIDSMSANCQIHV